MVDCVTPCNLVLSRVTLLPHTQLTPSREAQTDSLTMIVRREVEAMTPVAACPYTYDWTGRTIYLIHAVVRDEIASLALHSVCAWETTITATGFPHVLLVMMPRRATMFHRGTDVPTDLLMTFQSVSTAIALATSSVSATAGGGHLPSSGPSTIATPTSTLDNFLLVLSSLS